MTVAGYYNQTDKGLFWPQISAYSGGGIDYAGWANASTDYWAAYDHAQSLYGEPKAVWVEDCGSRGSYPTEVWSEIQQFFAILKQRSPDAVVYMSAISEFVPDGLCHLINATSMAQTEQMVRLAVASGLAHTGPIMGPLDASTTLADSRCHPNSAGELLLGSQLVQFFDGLSSSSSSSSGACALGYKCVTQTVTTTIPQITSTWIVTVTGTTRTETATTQTIPFTATTYTSAFYTYTETGTTYTFAINATTYTLAGTTETVYTYTLPATTSIYTTTILTTAAATTTNSTTPTTSTTTTTTTMTTTVTATTTSVSTSAASTYAYVSLGTTAIVILIVAALAAWVLRGRRS